MAAEHKVTGSQRVAAFLLSLDKGLGAEVMRHLDPKVLPGVAEAMTELDPSLCSPEAVDGLFAQLARSVFRGAGVRPQDAYELRDLLEATFGPDQAAKVLDAIEARRRQSRPFEFIEKAEPAAAARVLREESPAVVALVLSHVSPTTSAEVLGAFEPKRALEVVKRMTDIEPPGLDTILAVGADLERRLAGLGTPRGRERSESLRTVADLLNFSKSDAGKAVLEGIEEENGEVADQIREYMFTWDDLAKIDKRAMQKILASVDTKTLSMALKASPAPVEENIMGNLSSRVREMVADERETAGAVPLSEVVQARNEILKAARGLMEAGEFSPATGGEELVT